MGPNLRVCAYFNVSNHLFIFFSKQAVGQHDSDDEDDAENVSLQSEEKKKKPKRANQRESEQQQKEQRQRQRLCACCGKPRRPRRKEESKSPLSTDAPAAAAPAPAASDGRSASVLCELQQPQQQANAAPGWNYYRVGEEAEGDDKGGDGRRATTQARPQPPRTLPPRLRRRRAPSLSASPYDRDSTSPNLIVDRVARFEELSAIWASDPFLAAGGDTRAPRRSGRGLLAAAFAAEHALLGGEWGRSERSRRRSSVGSSSGSSIWP